MKKLLTVLLILTSMLCAKEMKQLIFYGTIKGSVTDYYPSLEVKYVYLETLKALSGVTSTPYNEITKMELEVINKLKQSAQKNCGNSTGYIFDNYNLETTNYSSENIFLSISLNVVCVVNK